MYSQITANKRTTWMLLVLVTAFIVVLFYLFGLYYSIDPLASILYGTIAGTIYGCFSYFSSQSITLTAHGAQAVSKTDAPELYRTLENLAIADGLPMPKLYIIQDESPNAFATGTSPENASVTVTTGLLRILNKQEIEGVLAHELSHIKNYDIRVMTIVVVLVGIVLLLANILLRVRPRRSDRDNTIGPIILVAGLLLAILSPLIAQLIRFAVSRTREYLADASGALLTRYPDGLASALAKIESVSAQQPLRTANNATAHLFISSPFGPSGKRFFGNLFSTHPPTADRIARLKEMGSQP